MKIHSVIRKGSEHRVFCEDFLWTEENERVICSAILDGCSTGKDSHFASSLYGKALRSQFSTLSFIDNKNLDQMAKFVLYNGLCQVNTVRAQLRLGIGELLATIIFSIFDKETKELFVIVIGDGVFTVNGEVFSIDQDNMPDYISYHIETLVNKDNFDSWFENFENKFTFKDVKDFSICSDGILSFKVNKETPHGEKEPVEFLTKDSFLINNPSMLARKCNILESKHEMVHTDDLSIIRIYDDSIEEKKESFPNLSSIFE